MKNYIDSFLELLTSHAIRRLEDTSKRAQEARKTTFVQFKKNIEFPSLLGRMSFPNHPETPALPKKEIMSFYTFA